MAELKVLDHILVTIEGLIGGQQTITTYPYFCYEAAANTQQVIAFGNMFTKFQQVGGLLDTYIKATPDRWTCTQLSIQDIYPTRFAAYRYPVNLPGNLQDTSSLTNVAGSITRRGDLGQQNNVGHVELPAPCDATYVLNGIFKPIYITQLGLHAVQMANDIIVGTSKFAPCLFRRKEPAQTTPVTQTFPQSTVRVVRRRTVGVGK